MADLKIKVSLGSFNVELEGPSEDVISQFDEIKKNGLGQMVTQLIPMFTQNKNSQDKEIKAIEEKETLEISEDQIIETTLKNVVIKMLPTFESEWVLVYGYFINTEGKDTFTRADIIQKYEESNRKTEARIKNLSASINGAVRKGWINAINDKDYVVTDAGKTFAKQILSRPSGTAKTPRIKPRKDKSNKPE